MTTSDGGVTWTAIFIPSDDIEDTTNVISIGTAWKDLADNTPVAGGSSANYTIDTKEPVITSVALDDSDLKAGETSTLTVTFSEAVTSFDNADITVENGTLTNITTSDGGVSWTGTFTPTDDIEDATNVISVGTVLTDLAGNSPLTGSRFELTTPIDTKEPVVVSSMTMSDTCVEAVGETATVTITFSEAVANFDNSDVTVENGTLTAVSSSDGGITWTGFDG